MSESRKPRGKSKESQAVAPEKIFKINRTLLLLGGIMLLGLVLRLLPALYAIIDGRVILTGPDSYYHMRRVMFTIFNYPFPNFFDPYVNYPYGFPIAWPPLFDVVAATAALLIGLGHPGVFTVEMASSLMSPLIGMATIALLYYFVRDAINEKAALISALIFAILPAGVFRSVFGLVDHHALEVLVSLALFLLFMRAVSSAKKSGLRTSSLSHPRPLIYAALAGVTAACAILSWDGAPIFVGIIAAYAFLQYAYNAKNKESSGYLSIAGFATFIVTLVIIAPMALIGMDRGHAFSALQLSWFHVIYLLAITLFFPAMGWLSGALQRRNAPWYSLPAAAFAAGSAGLAIIYLALPKVFNNLIDGLLYLSGNLDKVMTTISEVEPLFIVNGRFSLMAPWTFLSVAGPIAIAGFFIYLYSIKGKKLKDIEIFLLVSTAIILVLCLMQKRFINMLAVSASIFAGYALFSGLELAGLEDYLSRPAAKANKKKPSASRSGSMSATLLAACVVAVLLLIPVLLNSLSVVATPEFYVLDWNNACAWVDTNTPKTSGLYSSGDGARPEYGIMSWWDYGNYILYRAGRPAIANNFQTGINDSARFFVAQNESAADAIMDGLNAKYVMLDYRMGTPYLGVTYGIFENIAYLAGENPYSYHNNTTANITTSANAKYLNTMYSRLYNLDGCGGNVSGSIIDSLEHYRLKYFTYGVDPVKVFEYVKGATITGSADPGSVVELGLRLASPYGAKTYYSRTTAGQDGQYAFIVPYSTNSSSFIRTGDAYSIISGSLSTNVPVPESAVQAGDTIRASWARPSE